MTCTPGFRFVHSEFGETVARRHLQEGSGSESGLTWVYQRRPHGGYVEDRGVGREGVPEDLESEKKNGALVNHALSAPKVGSRKPDIGLAMRDRGPSVVVLVLSGAGYLRMGEHESRAPSSNSQKKRRPWQGEQGVQPDSTRRRSEVHPGPDLGHAISTLWLCDSAGSEMRESITCRGLKL